MVPALMLEAYSSSDSISQTHQRHLGVRSGNLNEPEIADRPALVLGWGAHLTDRLAADALQESGAMRAISRVRG
jgi:hypothetical protein